jgi:hypothetical protein
MDSKFFFKPFVIIPVAPIITGIIIHFVFHIRCISIRKLLYFISFVHPFASHFCPLVMPHPQYACFLIFVFNYYIWPICSKFSVCMYPLIP